MHVPNKEKIVTIILAMIFVSYGLTSRWSHSRHVPPQTALITTISRLGSALLLLGYMKNESGTNYLVVLL